MNIDGELRRLSEQGELTPPLAARYLTHSYGDRDWEGKLKELAEHIKKRNKNGAKSDLMRTIAFAFYLPIVQRSMDPNQEDESILFRGRYFRQFHDRDWFSDLRSLAEHDLKIADWRASVARAGIISHVQYQPFARQAFGWLTAKAEEVGAIHADKNKVRDRHWKFVQVYGGAPINALFGKGDLQRVANWATPYFVERAIYHAYSVDEVLNMKKAELNKTSSTLIQKIS